MDLSTRKDMSETPPVYLEHPAKGLSSLVPEETAAQLSKTTIRLFTEQPTYHDTLRELRNHEKFSYVIQWLYSMRGLIKLNNDNFDIDAFEEELLGISSPNFVNKFRNGLVQLLDHNKSAETTVDGKQFSKHVVDILPEVFANYSQADLENYDFDALSLTKQFDIYHELVMLCNSHNAGNLRRLVDKYEKPVDDCRPMIVFTQEDTKKMTKQEYLFLLDHRLYYRKWQFHHWTMPKSRQDLKVLTPKTFEVSDLEPKIVEWTNLTAGIYEFDRFVQDLHERSGKKTSTWEYKLYAELKKYVEAVAESDLERRKQAASRKREIQLQNLLQTRKKSSRLEERERKRYNYAESDFEDNVSDESSRSGSKRRRLRNGAYRYASEEVPLSREERAKLRRQRHVISEDGEDEEESSKENSKEYFSAEENGGSKGRSYKVPDDSDGSSDEGSEKPSIEEVELIESDHRTQSVLVVSD